MVKEMRVPSSSSSSSRHVLEMWQCEPGLFRSYRTDCDGLDLDTVFDVGIMGVIRILVLENVLAAKGVDKGSTT